MLSNYDNKIIYFFTVNPFTSTTDNPYNKIQNVKLKLLS